MKRIHIRFTSLISKKNFSAKRAHPSPHLSDSDYFSLIICQIETQIWILSMPHCNLCIPFLGIARPRSKFPHSCVCEGFIYSQSQDPRIGRSIVGIYKSLTDIRVWELGLWPRNSFSGNICFEFSVHCVFAV